MSISRSAVLPRRRVVRMSRPAVSAAVDLRTLTVCCALAALICGTGAVSVSVGDFPIPLAEVVPTIFGYGDEDAYFIVNTLRLPRLLTGMLVGAAFGASGAVFQSLARNPLASPDIIGVNAGAAAAAAASRSPWPAPRARHVKPRGRRQHS